MILKVVFQLDESLKIIVFNIIFYF